MVSLYFKLSLILLSMVGHCSLRSHVLLSVYVFTGVVLGVVCHGGLLLTSDQLSAGQLMAFLVATQTIQRYAPIYRAQIHIPRVQFGLDET